VVIAMTANAGRDDQARCLAAGMDEFVTKPISPNLLFEVIAKLDARAHARSGARMVTRPPVPAAGRAAPDRRRSDPGMLDMAALSRPSAAIRTRCASTPSCSSTRRATAWPMLDEALAAGDLARVADLGTASSRRRGRWARWVSPSCAWRSKRLREGGSSRDGGARARWHAHAAALERQLRRTWARPSALPRPARCSGGTPRRIVCCVRTDLVLLLPLRMHHGFTRHPRPAHPARQPDGAAARRRLRLAARHPLGPLERKPCWCSRTAWPNG
jgi:CheY-like chemotaxis protein